MLYCTKYYCSTSLKIACVGHRIECEVWKDHKAHLLLLFGVGDLTFLSLLLLINKVRTEQCYLQFLSSFIDVLCKIKYWSLFELKKKKTCENMFSDLERKKIPGNLMKRNTQNSAIFSMSTNQWSVASNRL